MEVKIIKDTLRDREIEAMVESESKPGIFYEVRLFKNTWNCTCPQNMNRHTICKYIEAAKEQTE